MGAGRPPPRELHPYDHPGTHHQVSLCQMRCQGATRPPRRASFTYRAIYCVEVRALGARDLCRASLRGVRGVEGASTST